MYWLWMSAGLLVAVWMQAVAGNMRIALPLVPVTAFYYAVPFGRTRVALLALPAAGLLDALLLDRGLTCIASTGVAILLAEFWRRHGNSRLWFVQAAPGAVIGLGTAVLTVLLQYGAYGLPAAGQISRSVLYILWMTAAGLALTPCAVVLLDACAERLRLQRFREARRHAGGLDHEAYP